MLRVHSEADAEGGVVLRLEGSLNGPWIAELQRAAQAAPVGRLAIDLSGLAYADRDGERLLRDLATRAELRGCSAFLREMLRGG